MGAAIRVGLVSLLLLAAAPARAGDPPPRGLAFLSSNLGREVPLAEAEAAVREFRIGRVIVDFAWITHHWERTDLAAVERLAARLAARGVEVAAMYRPRALQPRGIDVHFARDGKGKIAAHHNQLCFAHPDSVRWGASWGTRILTACPSIDRVILYNLGAVCRCEKCRGGRAADHTAAFLRACRREWRKVRPGVKIGHVGTGLEYGPQVDFLLPFLSLRRRAAGEPVDTVKLVAEWRRRTAAAGSRPCRALAKVCWASATRNRTEDLVSLIKTLNRTRTACCFWYYGWIFHSREKRYDPAAVAAALGGSWEKVAVQGAARPGKGPLDPRSWVWFDSRETKGGSRLVLHLAGGGRKTLEVAADTVLISYLADRIWGRLPRLSLTMGDTNRVLLRFPPAPAKGVEKAMLHLAMHRSQRAPSRPFTLAFHRLEGAWSETRTTWRNQPKYCVKPDMVATVDPRQEQVELDVTGHYRRWEQGVLLRSAEAAAAPAGGGAGEDSLLERVAALYPWASSTEDALARARREGRPVLALATAAGAPGKLTHQEEILFATLFCHPRVVRLVRENFVPLRLSCRAWWYLLGPGRGQPDPLAPLGTTLKEARAPALVAAAGDGRHLATLASLGTYDYGLLTAFLRRVLAAAGRKPGKEKAPPAGVELLRRGHFDRALAALSRQRRRSGEETYWLAALLDSRGDGERAQGLLRGLAGKGDAEPFALKAALRLAYPRRLGLGEPLAAPARPAAGPALAHAALTWLLDRQCPDGSFPVAARSAEYCIPGVTVLAAQAILRWLDQLEGKERRRAEAALDRADRWLEKHLAGADPARLNSFAAAYHLDYLLDRHERKRAGAARVQEAVKLLAAGACRNGAWAYDKTFGEKWRGGFGGWPVTTKGRTHSCNTGPALAALARAKQAGFAVDGKVLRDGIEALKAMRVRTGVYTYTWPEPRNFEKEDASVARAPVCELALFRLGGTGRGELRRTLDLFMRLRGGLRDSVKLTKGWIPPHGISSYFYFFAYRHAAEALAELKAKGDLAKLRADLLAVVEPDGTWVDYEDIGKCYGTAMALIVLEIGGLRLQ